MSRGSKRAVALLGLLAFASAGTLLLFANSACPAELPSQPCEAAGTNRLVVIALAATTATMAVVPFAFLGEFVLRRRIVYRGAWARALRRGMLVGAVVVTLAGLRLGGALTVAVAIFVALLAAAAEWFAVRRLDLP